MVRRLFLAAALFVLAVVPARPDARFSPDGFPFLDWSVPHRIEEAVIRYVYDGDTLQDSDQRAIRLLGVNTPEVAHPEHDKYENEPGGIEAMRYTGSLVKDKRVTLVMDEENHADRYGRSLALVFTRNELGEWVCVNWELVREGYGAALVMQDNRLCLEPEWYRINAVSKRRRAEDFQIIAKSFEKEGRPQNAVEAYQKGIRRFPDARVLYEELGALYSAMNLPGFTVDILLAYLERYPDDAGTRSRLARAYEHMAQAPLSMVDYKEKARQEWQKLVGTKHDGEARSRLAKLSN